MTISLTLYCIVLPNVEFHAIFCVDCKDFIVFKARLHYVINRKEREREREREKKT